MACQLSILVVDDDHDVREALRDSLRDVGYEVATAADGLEALSWLHTHRRPSLVLMDFMMPYLDGGQTRAAMLADPDLRAIPVVMLSADGRVREQVGGLDLEGCFEKPIDLRRLLDAVETAGRHAGRGGASALL